MEYGTNLMRVLIPALLFSLCSARSCGAVPSTADQEVLVMFHSGVIALPSGSKGELLESAQITLPSVLDLLSSYGVTAVIKAFPDLGPADTLMTAINGQTVVVPQWSEVYRLKVPPDTDVQALADSLENLEGVVLAEPNVAVRLQGPTYPNDPHFVDGDQWGLWNQAGSDAEVDCPQAWGYTTGANTVTIALLDAGFDPTHPDLAGRFDQADSDIGWDPSNSHGFHVAGIAAANANNGIGIAGIDWHCKLISRRVDGADSNAMAGQIVKVVNTYPRPQVINNSYTLVIHGQDTDSKFVHAAVAQAYRSGETFVTAVGNEDEFKTVYPAAYREAIAVAATTRTDQRWSGGGVGSNMGNYIDLAAPGDQMWGCAPDSSYEVGSGTSFAAPVVSAIAALLSAKKPDLGPDDIRELLEASAKDLGPAGVDSAFGYGRVNARYALELLGPPHILEFGSVDGGQDVGNSGPTRYQMPLIYGPSLTHTWWAIRHEIRTHVTFDSTFTVTPRVWSRNGAGTIGESADNPNFAVDWWEPIQIDPDNHGCTMRTYIYELYETPTGGTPQWFPVSSAAGVHCRYGALEVKPRPDVSTSFYVPQRGSVGTPTEGTSALSVFHACPNNDGTNLANNARIKVVIKDAAGNGIAGISAADIFIQLNGGTAAQGFIGDGADSVIANYAYNDSLNCPTLYAIPADSATDASGTTYITLGGSTPGQEGVGTRDGNRKWGHYDSELPVFALGQRISGRITTNDPTPYVLRIKNLDCVDGLGTVKEVGETVSSTDFNAVVNTMGVNNSVSYWRDFFSDGEVDANDFNLISQHVGHKCNYPNSQ